MTKKDNYQSGTIAEVFDYIKSTGQGYEHIDNKCVPYFDFDFSYSTEEEQQDRDEDDYETALTAITNEYADCSTAKFHKLTSCGYDARGDKWKNSYHIIVRGVGCYESGKALFDSLSDETKSVIDESVYKPAGRRQLFRMPFCSKEQDERPLMYIDPDDSDYEEIDDITPEQLGLLLCSNTDGEQLHKSTPMVIASSASTAKRGVSQSETSETFPKETNPLAYTLKIPKYVLSTKTDKATTAKRDKWFGKLVKGETFTNLDLWTAQKKARECVPLQGTQLTPSIGDDVNVVKTPLAGVDGSPKDFASLTRAEFYEFVKCIGKIADNSDGTGWGNATRLKFVYSAAAIRDRYKVVDIDIMKIMRAYSPNSDAEELRNLTATFNQTNARNNDCSTASFFRLAHIGDPERTKTVRHNVYNRIEGDGIEQLDQSINIRDDVVEELKEPKAAEQKDAEEDGLTFDVFRDYMKLLNAYKKSGGDDVTAQRKPLNGSAGIRWVKSSIVKIVNGGAPIFLTKNIRYTEEGFTQYYYKMVKPSDIRKSLNYNITFNGLRVCPQAKHGQVSTLAGMLNYCDNEGLIPEYNEMDFMPYYDKQKPMIDTYNLFTGFPLKIAIDKSVEKPTGDMFKGSKLFKHVRDELCDGDIKLFEWLMRWVGHIIQRPSTRTGTMPMIQSDQGAGKDLFGEFISLMVGKNHALKFSQMNQFMGKFNVNQVGKLFIVLNEMSDKTKNKADHNQLKDKIDRKTINAEPKGVDPYEVKDYANYMGFSNFKDTLYIENSDRRYCMIEANNRMCNNKEYFAPIWAELGDNDMLMSAFTYFATLDVSRFMVEDVPETQYKRDQKINNLASTYRFIIAKLEEDNREITRTAKDFYTEFTEWCGEEGERAPQKKTFVAKLKAIDIVSRSKRIGRQVKKCYVINPIDFTTAMRQHMRDDSFTLDTLDEPDEVERSDDESESEEE